MKAMLDFDRLLGFDLIAAEFQQALDFSQETFGAKLGAKLGGEPDTFAGIDFKGETIGAKLGAKLGEPT